MTPDLNVAQEVGRCQTLKHVLPCGLHLEVLHQAPVHRHASSHRQQHQLPPVLFLHGAMHGAWCWQVTLKMLLCDASLLLLHVTCDGGRVPSARW
jgi:hypothetical protein